MVKSIFWLNTKRLNYRNTEIERTGIALSTRRAKEERKFASPMKALAASRNYGEIS
jgi:hypothetical protein